MQSTATPLQIHSDTVKAEWIDYNGHMNDGYYVVAFTSATDALQDAVGLDRAYRQSSGCSIYTVEAHIQYLREVKVDTRLHFSTWVLGVDTKRLHVLHAMVNTDNRYLAATHELMLLHVDQKVNKTCAMPQSIRTRLNELSAAHRKLKLPVEVGRAIKAVEEFSRSV